MAVGAISPVKGERSDFPIVIHADPRSRDAIANDIPGAISQIDNPQPPTKDGTVGDVQFVIPWWQIILDNLPHPSFGEAINFWGNLGAFPVPKACRTDGVPLCASVLCSTACCFVRREVLRLRIAAD